MLKRFAITCTFLSALTAHNAAYAQDTSKGNAWLSGGIGKSYLPSGMLAAGYEFANKPTLLIARYILNTELLSNRQPGLRLSEASLLYGLRTGKFRFSTGLSGLWGVDRGQLIRVDPDPLIYGSHYYEPVNYATVGIPAEIRFITSTKTLGIGVTAFGNLNATRSFAGLNLSFYAGKMN